MQQKQYGLFSLPVIVGSLGFFVDIYDLMGIVHNVEMKAWRALFKKLLALFHGPTNTNFFSVFRVFNNLVGNAFQHASGGELLVSGDSARLLIADTGPGFRDVADPFAPFDKQPQSAGSGLGLAIVRRLCDAAGIALSWRSNPSGPGTQFSLDFSHPGSVSIQ